MAHSPTGPDTAPVCRLVSDDADALARALEAAGWTVGDDDATAQLLLLDLRTTSDEALPEIVSQTARDAVCPIFAIVRDDQHRAVGALAAIGVDQLLTEPFSENAFAHQLALAAAHLEPDLQGLAGRDPLTGLADARALTARARDWTSATAGSERLHGMLIGIRRLEAVNATYGSKIGDAVLIELANRIAETVALHGPKRVACGRQHGSEFLVLGFGEEDRAAWGRLAEEIIEQLAHPVRVAGHKLRLTARAGLALARPDETHASLVERLSAALAQAHHEEALTLLWGDRASDRAPAGGHRLENDIMQAIERDEITVLFQPQFSIATGRLTGAEALARWQHADLGEIGAGTLFALAKRTDFTRALSRHIRQLALQAAQSWPKDLSELRLSLNLTAQDLAERDFARSEIDRIQRSGFPLDRTTIEITESALVPNLKKAAKLFGELREAGAAIAVDDFGTGYSNLLYLKSLPLDYLKMDHAMTRDIVAAPRERIIARNVIALAKALDLGVIAEGVESEEQLAALAEEGCDYYQGFLRSRALTSDEFVAFARAWL